MTRRISNPYEKIAHKTERTNNQKLVQWMNETIQQKDLTLGSVEQETSGADRKQPDIVIKKRPGSEEIICVIELKPPAFLDPFNEAELVEPARTKATRRHSSDSEEQKYVGAKWGKYLRAPKIFFTILEKGKLVSLKQVAKVKRGFTTGANEFFYLTEDQIKKWRIEKEVWMHKDEKGRWAPNYVIKSPRECPSILVKPEDLKNRVLMIHKDKKALKGTNILKYIEWGEKKGYHKRPTCASREKWYDLGKRKPWPLIHPMVHNNRQVIAYNSLPVYIDHNLFEINPREEGWLNAIFSFLLSSPAILIKEFGGRVNLGEGALKTEGIDIERMLIMNPGACSSGQLESLRRTVDEIQGMEIRSVFEEIGTNNSESVNIKKVKADRRRLDEIVMGDILGLTEEEQLEVYQAVIDLVKTRLERAKSLKKGKKTKDGLDLGLLAQNVLDRIGEHNLPTFYQERIATVPCYSLDLPKPEESVEIENSLFGWRLKIGKKAIDCTSEAQARYLRVFAEMGWDQTMVPKDDAYLSSIVNQWEALFEKAQAALQEHTSSILQSKTRDLLIHTVWARLREKMS